MNITFGTLLRRAARWSPRRVQQKKPPQRFGAAPLNQMSYKLLSVMRPENPAYNVSGVRRGAR